MTVGYLALEMKTSQTLTPASKTSPCWETIKLPMRYQFYDRKARPPSNAADEVMDPYRRHSVTHLQSFRDTPAILQVCE